MIADLVRDLVPDLMRDLVPDLMRDLVPDLVPDLMRDLVPDLVPDLAPDLAPDLVLDAAPDHVMAPFLTGVFFWRGAFLQAEHVDVHSAAIRLAMEWHFCESPTETAAAAVCMAHADCLELATQAGRSPGVSPTAHLEQCSLAAMQFVLRCSPVISFEASHVADWMAGERHWPAGYMRHLHRLEAAIDAGL
jgi:hypothetical protein